MRTATASHVLHGLGDLVLILDRKQRVVGVYGDWIIRGRVTASQFAGKTIEEDWPREHAQLHVKMNAHALSGHVVIYEWEYPFSGDGRRVITTLYPLFGPRGVTGIVRVMRDIVNSSTFPPMPKAAIHQVIAATPESSRGRSASVATTRAVRRARKILAGLSLREKHVVGLLLDSHRTSQIAQQLRISVHTVRQHIKNVLRKSNVHSQQELLDALRTKSAS